MFMPIIPIIPDLDKLIRAQAVSPWQEAGRIWLPDPTLPQNGWVGDFIDACATFPNALFKDEIDSLSQVLTYIMTMAMGGRIISDGKRRTVKLLESFRKLM
jgi:predicted phage terminase large subunit-like protein